MRVFSSPFPYNHQKKFTSLHTFQSFQSQSHTIDNTQKKTPSFLTRTYNLAHKRQKLAHQQKPSHLTAYDYFMQIHNFHQLNPPQTIQKFASFLTAYTTLPHQSKKSHTTKIFQTTANHLDNKQPATLKNTKICTLAKSFNQHQEKPNQYTTSSPKDSKKTPISSQNEQISPTPNLP